jgi:hypothetical protein
VLLCCLNTLIFSFSYDGSIFILSTLALHVPVLVGEFQSFHRRALQLVNSVPQTGADTVHAASSSSSTSAASATCVAASVDFLARLVHNVHTHSSPASAAALLLGSHPPAWFWRAQQRVASAMIGGLALLAAWTPGHALLSATALRRLAHLSRRLAVISAEAPYAALGFLAAAQASSSSTAGFDAEASGFLDHDGLLGADAARASSSSATAHRARSASDGASEAANAALPISAALDTSWHLQSELLAFAAACAQQQPLRQLLYADTGADADAEAAAAQQSDDVLHRHPRESQSSAKLETNAAALWASAAWICIEAHLRQEMRRRAALSGGGGESGAVSALRHSGANIPLHVIEASMGMFQLGTQSCSFFPCLLMYVFTATNHA